MEEEIKTKPITLIRRITDRHKRRQSEFEAEKILDDILVPAYNFYNDLFDEEIMNDDTIDYSDLYKFYLERYGQIVEWNNRVRKPKYFRINENYFPELFKPIEKEY